LQSHPPYGRRQAAHTACSRSKRTT
jgi:hypothetical protein